MYACLCPDVTLYKHAFHISNFGHVPCRDVVIKGNKVYRKEVTLTCST
jgi:hypothetical protein